MKQQFVLTHRYTFLQETEKNLTYPYCTTGKQVMFLRKHKDKQFFMDTTF